MALWWLQRQIRPIGFGGLRNAAHGDGSRLPHSADGQRRAAVFAVYSLEGREAVGGHSLSAFTSPAAAHETASLPQARPPLIVQCLACAGNPLAVHGFVLRSAVQPVVRAASRGLSAWPLPDLKAERFLVGVRGHLV